MAAAATSKPGVASLFLGAQGKNLEMVEGRSYEGRAQVESIVLSIISMLSSPNDESPANIEAAELLLAFEVHVVSELIENVNSELYQSTPMGESLQISYSSKNLEVPSVTTKRSQSKRCLVASAPKALSQKAFKLITSLDLGKLGNGTTSHIALFLLKVTALEMVRRFSRAHCPFAWRGLQGLQFLCYPPFKWIQRWAPFKGLVKCMQTLSRPLLALSIATAFSDQSECCKETSDALNDSRPYSEPHSEPPTIQSTLDTGICDEAPQNLASEHWLLQLYEELEKQGITLPERINEDELRRFYIAADGDFSCFLSSIKKTIRWRETYSIFSVQELEMWSHFIFWHGCDVKLRPCLFIRLGLACSSLASHDRPRFAQAVEGHFVAPAVSQMEYGVLHLVDVENPQISVVMDCEGLSPFGFPMQITRSCSALLQDHYPNRLGCLVVTRLPPVVRVIAQTFIQVLKPVTRHKLRIEGEMYQKVLSEYIQILPSFLGGKCTCTKCSTLAINDIQHRRKGTKKMEPSADFTDDDDLISSNPTYLAVHMNENCDHILRSAIVGVLMVWLFIALIAGMYDPDSLPLFSP
ncbi:hypothetical protein HHK36_019043 [Tetracentron sinense]|uniref:CRAL-TRIO domain-containing protein n=2 Tax=Magnoliopsida TaxID=3398 RepID=A0A835DBV0_TETSI|nr:hypothetical protein HHK36_019043 [Tetracentron sinense]